MIPNIFAYKFNIYFSQTDQTPYRVSSNEALRRLLFRNNFHTRVLHWEYILRSVSHDSNPVCGRHNKHELIILKSLQKEHKIHAHFLWNINISKSESF